MCLWFELPTASGPKSARVYCGYRLGPTRVPLPSRQDGGNVRAPALSRGLRACAGGCCRTCAVVVVLPSQLCVCPQKTQKKSKIIQQIVHMLTKVSFTFDTWNALMVLFGIVSQSFHRRARLQSLLALVPSAHKMAKRSRPSVDEVSKGRGPSSNAHPKGSRAFALAAVRHQKSSPLISAQEKTQSDVPSQEEPGQASGDRMHSPCTTRNPGGRARSRQDGMNIIGCGEWSSRLHRLRQGAAGRKIPASVNALGDRRRSV